MPAEVFPPGEFIRYELRARGLTHAHLADVLNYSLAAVNDILVGNQVFNYETPKGFGEALGVDPVSG